MCYTISRITSKVLYLTYHNDFKWAKEISGNFLSTQIKHYSLWHNTRENLQANRFNKITAELCYSVMRKTEYLVSL